MNSLFYLVYYRKQCDRFGNLQYLPIVFPSTFEKIRGMATTLLFFSRIEDG